MCHLIGGAWSFSLPQREKPVVDTLTLPAHAAPPYPDGDRYEYWLRLASIALGDENTGDRLVIEEPDQAPAPPSRKPAPQKAA